MKKIKIFLASSIVEFREERNIIGNCVRKIQDDLIDKDIRINLFECEFADNSIALGRKQEEYNEEIKKSDMFIMLVGGKIGAYTLEEFDIAKKSNVKNIIVILKNVKCSDEVEKLKEVIKNDKSIEAFYYSSNEELKENISKIIKRSGN